MFKTVVEEKKVIVHLWVKNQASLNKLSTRLEAPLSLRRKKRLKTMSKREAGL